MQKPAEKGSGEVPVKLETMSKCKRTKQYDNDTTSNY